MGYSVLHIADPHFSKELLDKSGEKPSVVGADQAEAIMNVLGSHPDLPPHYDAIVFSGDFTVAYAQAGFEAAAAFIEKLAECTNRHAIVVVPGNHDVVIGAEPVLFGGFSIPISRIRAEQSFREFLRAIEPFVDSHGNAPCAVRRIQTGEAFGLVLLGLNSCRVERHDARGWGYVGLDQIAEAVQEAMVIAHEGDVVLAVMHHNLLPVLDLRWRDLLLPIAQRTFSFNIDAASSLAALTDLGIAAVLHGHTHIPSHKGASGYGEPGVNWSKAVLPVVGAGGLKYNDERGGHYIQVVEVFSTSIRITDFEYSYPLSAAKADAAVRLAGHRDVSVSWVWNSERVRRQLVKKAEDIEAARVDWEWIESWARLRNKGSDDWPITLGEIRRQTEELLGRPIVPENRLGELIDEVCKDQARRKENQQLMLQEVLCRRLREELRDK